MIRYEYGSCAFPALAFPEDHDRGNTSHLLASTSNDNRNKVITFLSLLATHNE